MAKGKPAKSKKTPIYKKGDFYSMYRQDQKGAENKITAHWQKTDNLGKRPKKSKGKNAGNPNDEMHKQLRKKPKSLSKKKRK